MPLLTFDTAFGACALAWSPAGLTRVRLPEPGPAAGACAAAPGTAPAFVEAAVAALTAHLAGEDAALDEIPLDAVDTPPFHTQVYRALRAVPRGATVTFGELARRVDRPGAARAVGVAMRRNPWPVIVPCHRVLAGGGRLGGFSAPGGAGAKSRLLALEGVRLDETAQLDLFGP